MRTCDEKSPLIRAPCRDSRARVSLEISGTSAEPELNSFLAIILSIAFLDLITNKKYNSFILKLSGINFLDSIYLFCKNSGDEQIDLPNIGRRKELPRDLFYLLYKTQLTQFELGYPETQLHPSLT